MMLLSSLLLGLLVVGAPMVPPAETLVPGDGLGLDPDAVVASPVGLPVTPTGSSRPMTPVLPVGFGVGAVGVGLAYAGRRKRRAEPLYVLVHGDGGSPDDFDELLAAMGIGRDQTVAFDYRTVAEGTTSKDASRHAMAVPASVELDRLIRDLAVDNANIYSIHHSKGGAVGVEMIASLDDGTRPTIEGYRGAALLDPAIGSGLLGGLQRAGGPITQLPDNGGFDPRRCGSEGCRDIRIDLGEASGVEVIAIRNPDALVTNFVDDPVGLRTFDLIDDGKRSAWFSSFSVWSFSRRIFEAHGSVLTHRAVADCVAAEVTEAGTCHWEGGRKEHRPWWQKLDPRELLPGM